MHANLQNAKSGIGDIIKKFGLVGIPVATTLERSLQKIWKNLFVLFASLLLKLAARPCTVCITLKVVRDEIANKMIT